MKVLARVMAAEAAVVTGVETGQVAEKRRPPASALLVCDRETLSACSPKLLLDLQFRAS